MKSTEQQPYSIEVLESSDSRFADAIIVHMILNKIDANAFYSMFTETDQIKEDNPDRTAVFLVENYDDFSNLFSAMTHAKNKIKEPLPMVIYGPKGYLLIHMMANGLAKFVPKLMMYTETMKTKSGVVGSISPEETALAMDKLAVLLDVYRNETKKSSQSGD